MAVNEVLVGLDNSPSAKAALHWAAQYARAGNLSLKAVHVYQQTYIPVVASTGLLVTEYMLDEESRELTRATMQGIFVTVEPEPTWRLELVDGPIGHELVSRAADARLLVIGTREHTGVGRIVKGSVSHYCLSHTACPVVAVPAPTKRSGKQHRNHSPAVGVS